MSVRNSGTRRRVALLGLVGVVGLSVFALSPGAHAAPTLDTDLTHYTLFAQDNLSFKGANSGGGIIAGGNIGVNNWGGQLNICGGGSGHSTTLDPNTQVAAFQMTVGASCVNKQTDAFIGTLGTSRISGQFRSVTKINWPAVHGFIYPASPADPNWKYFHASWPTAQKCKGTEVWGNSSSGTITSGKTVFCNLSIGKNARVHISPTVKTIYVLGFLSVGDGAVVGDDTGPNASAGVQWFVRGDGVATNNAAVTFGRNAKFTGSIDALEATYTRGINLGNSTLLKGRFWAEDIGSDWGTIVTPPPGPTTTTSTTRASSTTSTSSTSTTSSTSSTSSSTTTSTAPPTSTTTSTIPEQ